MGEGLGLMGGGRAAHRRVDAFLARWTPGLAARRQDARVRLQQGLALEAAYRSAQRDAQRGPSGEVRGSSENWHLLADLDETIERSRETWRNNSIYSGVCRRSVDNMLGGVGVRVIPKTGDKELDQALQEAWEAHGEADGDLLWTRRSFAQAQRMILLTAMREGNVLAYRSSGGWQLFEGAQIGTPMGYDRRAMQIHNGVQVDGQGRETRYWVAEYSKYGFLETASARGIRASECLLLGNPEYLSGYRAMPALQNALDRFDDVDGYLEAELFGSRMAASVLGEIKATDDKVWRALNTAKEDSTAVKDGMKRIQFKPGTLFRSLPGEEFKLHYIQRPGQSFPDYMRVMFRVIGMPVGMPLELAFMDFSETNFSAAKFMMLQAQRTLEVWLMLVLAPWVRRAYRDWLAEQTEVRIKKSTRRPGGFELQYPRSQWIDALKEAQARFVGLKAGYTSLTEICRELNREVEDVLTERAEELVMARAVCEKAQVPELFPLLVNQIGDLREILELGKGPGDAADGDDGDEG